MATETTPLNQQTEEGNCKNLLFLLHLTSAVLVVNIPEVEQCSTEINQQTDRKGLILSLVILIGSIPALIGA